MLVLKVGIFGDLFRIRIVAHVCALHLLLLVLGHPRMLKDFCDGYTIVWLLSKHFLQEVFKLSREMRMKLFIGGIEYYTFFNNHGFKIFSGLTAEWYFTNY